MKNTFIYLLRHAQSHPSTSRDQSDWPLSEVGKKQSSLLSQFLQSIKVDVILSSPYLRCIQTIEPYINYVNSSYLVENDFRERLISKEIIDGFYQVWLNSWKDFTYSLPDCESSKEAQNRFVRALTKHEKINRGRSILICTHGNVMGLCLNWINSRYGRIETENIRNPDVLKLIVEDGVYYWDEDFELDGIAEIATDHRETKID